MTEIKFNETLECGHPVGWLLTLSYPKSQVIAVECCLGCMIQKLGYEIKGDVKNEEKEGDTENTKEKTAH